MKLSYASFALCSLFSSAASQTVVDVAANDGRFTTLVKAVTDADLVGDLSGDGPLTVFAPVDDAFAAVPPKFLEPMWSAHLKNILMYHVLGAKVMSTDLAVNLTATTLNKEDITITSLDPVQVNGVDVIIPDVNASNGVIHVVDEVLLPNAATKSIVDLAVATPELSKLVELVTAAGLVETLSGDGSFTVFGPTNDAFAMLSEETLNSLTDPANVDDLKKILTFHVINNAIVLSDELSDDTQVSQMESVSGTTSPLTVVNASMVVFPDILASNGVVHVVNQVLMPPMEDDHHGHNHSHNHSHDSHDDEEEKSADSSAPIKMAVFATLSTLISFAAFFI